MEQNVQQSFLGLKKHLFVAGSEPGSYTVLMASPGKMITRVEISTLSLILLAIGIAGFLGTLVIGGLLKTGFYQTLILIPLFMAAIAGALMIFGHNTAVVAILLALWGLVATAAPVGWWTWVARTLPDDAEAGGGLMVAVVQMCIALGSVAGGMARWQNW